jgi:FkbM family methyltransferase
MSVLGTLKRVANHRLEHFGQAITHIDYVPSFERLTGLLDRVGLAPRTIIDVGVAQGTPWIYEAYPHAKYFLFDPTPHSLPHMQAWAKKLDAEVFNIALGDKETTMPIAIRTQHSDSTMFQDRQNVASVEQIVDVPVRRFDQICPPFTRPCLMKIDTQGAELMILQGLGDRITEIDCCIVETSPLQTLPAAPDFSDVMSFMMSKGFCLFDITGLHRRPYDRALASMDAVFVPRTSPLRAVMRWD